MYAVKISHFSIWTPTCFPIRLWLVAMPNQVQHVRFTSHEVEKQDRWHVDWSRLAGRRFESVLSWLGSVQPKNCRGSSTVLWYNLWPMTPEVTILNYRAPIRLSISLSPPSQQSSEMRKWNVAMCYTVSSIRSFADPNFRLHKPELRGYACLTYEQKVTPLLSYLKVDKTVSAGLN